MVLTISALLPECRYKKKQKNSRPKTSSALTYWTSLYSHEMQAKKTSSTSIFGISICMQIRITRIRDNLWEVCSKRINQFEIFQIKYCVDVGEWKLVIVYVHWEGIYKIISVSAFFKNLKNYARPSQKSQFEGFLQQSISNSEHCSRNIL